MEKNESVEHAVKREVFEELGIALVHVIEIKTYTTNFDYKVDTVHCFYAKVDTKNFVMDKKEILEASWFPKSSLPENIARSIKESVAVLVK